jgi:hypothetical protein
MLKMHKGPYNFDNYEALEKNLKPCFNVAIHVDVF